LPVHVGALDRAAVPLRPDHAPRLEGAAARGARIRHDHGGGDPRARHAGRAVRPGLRPHPHGREPRADRDLPHAARPRPRDRRHGALEAPAGAAAAGDHRHTPAAGGCDWRITGSGGRMAINVKTVRRPEGKTSYLRATLRGMALTFRHLLDEKQTLEYPDVKPELAPRWRGTHRMAVHADGRPKCVAC